MLGAATRRWKTYCTPYYYKMELGCVLSSDGNTAVFPFCCIQSGTCLVFLWFLVLPFYKKTHLCLLIGTARNHQTPKPPHRLFFYSLISGLRLFTWLPGPQGVNLDQVSLSTHHPCSEARLTYRKLLKYPSPPALEACISSNLHPLRR